VREALKRKHDAQEKRDPRKVKDVLGRGQREGGVVLQGVEGCHGIKWWWGGGNSKLKMGGTQKVELTLLLSFLLCSFILGFIRHP